MTAIKICGITRLDDAAYAAAQGADYLGFNFWPQSKRVVDPYVARAACKTARVARADVRCVGVFVDAPVEEIAKQAAFVGLDAVQLHGDEPAAAGVELAARGLEVWRAVGVRSVEDIDRLGEWPASIYVLDAPSPGRGGSGERFDPALAARAVAAGFQIFVAGGLDARNVASVIHQVAPFGVDVASGVETSPGDKDPVKVWAFCQAARRKISYLKP